MKRRVRSVRLQADQREPQTNRPDVLPSVGDSLREWAPPLDEERGALDRVWNSLRWKANQVPAEAVHSVELQTKTARWDRRATVRALAAAAMIIVAVGAAMLWPRGVQAYSAGADGLQVTLADDSSVEMRAHAEMTVARESDGIQIDLKTGDIIVTAARRDGRLHVRTNDMNVAVEGTALLVNAGSDGSRVAVIEGEVRVVEGTVEKRLRPGEQTATSPTMARLPVKEAITWSRYADVHIAQLDTFMQGMARSAGPLTAVARRAAPPAPQATAPAQAPEFEEASIRECDPDEIPAAPAGARGGGANSFYQTPGRSYMLCMTLATIIRTAFGYSPADLDFMTGGRVGRGPGAFNIVYGLGVEDGLRVRGGPDWIRTQRYTIEAVADGAAASDVMRGPMLRALLERRFKLKAHVETEQLPAWTLTIAPSGLKIKPVDDGTCEAQPAIGRGQPAIVRPAQPGERQPPPPSTPGQPVTVLFRNFVDVRKGETPTCGISTQRNGPNQVVVAGGITLDALARNLALPLGGVVVTDKTGNTDKFNIVLEYVRDENVPGPRFLTANQPEPASDVPRGQTIFLALEQQLGLKLEPAKAPRDFIVIDQVERPSAN